MAMLAKSWDQVMAREYTSRGTAQQQWDDALGIASAIYNRSVALGVDYNTVVQNKGQFNGYMNQLSPGDMARIEIAKQAMAEVETNGPVHTGMYFATPRAVAGLPSGLVETGYAVDTGHVFKADPYGRAIAVKGNKYVKPDLQALDQEIALKGVQTPVPQARPADVPLGVPTPEVNPMDTATASLSPVSAPLAATAAVPGIGVAQPTNAVPATADVLNSALADMAANQQPGQLVDFSPTAIAAPVEQAQAAAPKTSRLPAQDPTAAKTSRLGAVPVEQAQAAASRFAEQAAAPKTSRLGAVDQAAVDPMMAATQGPYTANGLTNTSAALDAAASVVPVSSIPAANPITDLSSFPNLAQALPANPVNTVSVDPTAGLAAALGGMSIDQATGPSASTSAAQSAMSNGMPADPMNPGFWGDIAARQAQLDQVGAAAAASPASDAAARAAMAASLPGQQAQPTSVNPASGIPSIAPGTAAFADAARAYTGLTRDVVDLPDPVGGSLVGSTQVAVKDVAGPDGVMKTQTADISPTYSNPMRQSQDFTITASNPAPSLVTPASEMVARSAMANYTPPEYDTLDGNPPNPTASRQTYDPETNDLTAPDTTTTTSVNDLPAVQTRESLQSDQTSDNSVTDATVPDAEEASTTTPSAATSYAGTKTSNGISTAPGISADTRGPLSITKALGLPAHPLSSFLASLFNPAQSAMPGVNNIGGGLANVASVYGGAPVGTQAYTNNNGLVTALGGGATAYTNPYGVTTITTANGQQAADWSGRNYGSNPNNPSQGSAAAGGKR